MEKYLLEQLKNSPPIETQLEMLSQGQPLPKINVSGIGEIECLLTSIKPDKLKMVETHLDNRGKGWKVSYENKWLTVEEYISNLFRFAGFSPLSQCPPIIIFRVMSILKIPDNKMEFFCKKDLSEDIWSLYGGYLDKKYKRAIEALLDPRKSWASGSTHNDPVLYKELKTFIANCPEDKIKKIIHIEDLYFNRKYLERAGVSLKSAKFDGMRWRHGGQGLPDLFLYNEQRKEYLFCEVKSEKDRIFESQMEFINYNRKYNVFPCMLAIILKGDYPQWDIRDKSIKGILFKEQVRSCVNPIANFFNRFRSNNGLR